MHMLTYASTLSHIHGLLHLTKFKHPHPLPSKLFLPPTPSPNCCLRRRVAPHQGNALAEKKGKRKILPSKCLSTFTRSHSRESTHWVSSYSTHTQTHTQTHREKREREREREGGREREREREKGLTGCRMIDPGRILVSQCW